MSVSLFFLYDKGPREMKLKTLLIPPFKRDCATQAKLQAFEYAVIEKQHYQCAKLFKLDVILSLIRFQIY